MDNESAYQQGLLDQLRGRESLVDLLLIVEHYDAAQAYECGQLVGNELLVDDAIEAA